jgi:hypothetical protein
MSICTSNLCHNTLLAGRTIWLTGCTSLPQSDKKHRAQDVYSQGTVRGIIVCDGWFSNESFKFLRVHEALNTLPKHRREPFLSRWRPVIKGSVSVYYSATLVCACVRAPHTHTHTPLRAKKPLSSLTVTTSFPNHFQHCYQSDTALCRQTEKCFQLQGLSTSSIEDRIHDLAKEPPCWFRNCWFRITYQWSHKLFSVHAGPSVRVCVLCGQVLIC